MHSRFDYTLALCDSASHRHAAFFFLPLAFKCEKCKVFITFIYGLSPLSVNSERLKPVTLYQVVCAGISVMPCKKNRVCQ